MVIAIEVKETVAKDENRSSEVPTLMKEDKQSYSKPPTNDQSSPTADTHTDGSDGSSPDPPGNLTSSTVSNENRAVKDFVVEIDKASSEPQACVGSPKPPQVGGETSSEAADANNLQLPLVGQPLQQSKDSPLSSPYVSSSLPLGGRPTPPVLIRRTSPSGTGTKKRLVTAKDSLSTMEQKRDTLIAATSETTPRLSYASSPSPTKKPSARIKQRPRNKRSDWFVIIFLGLCNSLIVWNMFLGQFHVVRQYHTVQLETPPQQRHKQQQHSPVVHKMPPRKEELNQTPTKTRTVPISKKSVEEVREKGDTPLLTLFQRGESPSELVSRIDNREKYLQQNIGRYYIYDDENITQPRLARNLMMNAGRGELKERLRPGALMEHYLLDALWHGQRRTLDPNSARFFIVPLRVGAAVTHRGKQVPAVIKALNESKTWNGGNDHVLLALNDETFAYSHLEDAFAQNGFPEETVHFFQNVTIAKAYDDNACAQLNQLKVSHDFADLFEECKYTMTRSSFSVGRLPEPNLTVIDATFQKFSKAKNWIFYRPPEAAEPTSLYNSTEYRQAPLRKEVLEGLPQPSSVGPPLSPDEWHQELTSSKFCLVIRGDTPQSHMLLRSVVVGCIPVVVSDFYPKYAPSFPSSLDMADFSIFIDEEDFLKDPAAALSQLAKLSPQRVRAKLRALRFAQRVVALNHPNSLLLAAFAREAKNAMKKPTSKFLLY